MNQLTTKYRTVILIALVVLLAVASIFIGIQISRNNQAADPTKAIWCDVPPPGGCDGQWAGVCEEWKWTSNPTDCGAGLGECTKVNVCNQEPPPGDECSITVPGGVAGGMLIIANCGTNTYTMETYKRAVSSGTTHGDCVGTSVGRFDRTVTNGTYNPAADSIGCGYCVQYDIAGHGGTAAYTGDCTTPTPRCGDGIKNGTEQCDDGNSVNGDGCENNCTNTPVAPVCGDGIKNGTEQCDPRANPTGCTTGESCTASCTCRTTPPTPICGDGIKNGTEQCDDGNTINGDGCENNCTTTTLTPKACGSTCTSDAGCNTGLSCVTGTCQLAGCTPTTCTNNNCTPICGGPCTPGGTNTCPTGHSCDANTSKCVSDACKSNPADCDAKLCSNLPKTALITDEVDLILVAAFLILAGIAVYRFNLVQSLLLTGYGVYEDNWSVRAQIEKTRKKFEEQLGK